MPFDEALEAKVSSLPREQAAEALLRGYGGEIYSFICTIAGSHADDAFSLFCEDAWRGLAGFRGASSYRTWLYQVARHAAFRQRRGEQRLRMDFDDGAAAEKIAAEVRTTTAAFMRTEVKDKLRALRDTLREEDRELLMLRLDRQLEWADIAVILDADAATLRKRFERLKEKLRALAKKSGLIAGS